MAKCGCCGKDIGEIVFDKSYKMPDDIWNLSPIEKEERAQIDSDLCRLDNRYFIRGVAYLPVNGTDHCYGWGIWAEVPQEDFFNYLENQYLGHPSVRSLKAAYRIDRNRRRVVFVSLVRAN